MLSVMDDTAVLELWKKKSWTNTDSSIVYTLTRQVETNKLEVNGL